MNIISLLTVDSMSLNLSTAACYQELKVSRWCFEPATKTIHSSGCTVTDAGGGTSATVITLLTFMFHNLKLIWNR